MSIRAPSFLRRIFQSRRLSALAASAIGKDLRGFRQVVLARPLATICSALWPKEQPSRAF